jgi:Mor family transcriptional regulator
MMDGASTAVHEPLGEDGATLRHDMRCILVECHRDRSLAALRDNVQPEDIDALADAVARRLAPRIGGRYVPKRDDRAVRDAAVWARFNGRNHKDVMREFSISRRLLYSILARRRRVPVDAGAPMRTHADE